jgi:hypothetical protein
VLELSSIRTLCFRADPIVSSATRLRRLTGDGFGGVGLWPGRDHVDKT